MATVSELLVRFKRQFQQADVGSPRLTAELLLARVLGVSRGELRALGARELTTAETRLFEALAQRRLSREPIDYILGEREFYGRRFNVRAGVLVPRPETETIIDIVKRELPGYTGWAADIGTGSGVLAVTLAAELPGIRVLATDVSLRALLIARENARLHGVADRVHFARMDALSAVRARLGLIVGNPPYIDVAEVNSLQPEVRDHEPPEALFGGHEGLQTPRRFIEHAAAHIAPGGWCLLEHAFNQGPTMREMAAAAGLRDARTVKDMTGLDRVLIARG
jgi:release factor glutamine methyltransferase